MHPANYGLGITSHTERHLSSAHETVSVSRKRSLPAPPGRLATAFFSWLTAGLEHEAAQFCVLL